MGFTSKCCAKTNLPVLNQYKGHPEFSEVVALLPMVGSSKDLMTAIAGSAAKM